MREHPIFMRDGFIRMVTEGVSVNCVRDFDRSNQPPLLRGGGHRGQTERRGEVISGCSGPPTLPQKGDFGTKTESDGNEVVAAFRIVGTPCRNCGIPHPIPSVAFDARPRVGR